jgi:UDPglucose 6-dehydrogenase
LAPQQLADQADLAKTPLSWRDYMKIGFVGLGKLGLPCAVATAIKGHDVMGYDIVANLMNTNPRAYRETGPDGKQSFNAFLKSSTLTFGSLETVIAHSEIVFVAVQTPHDPLYEGVTRTKGQTADFDYRYLISAIKEIAAVARRQIVVAIISTVLPGTIRRCVRPIKGSHIRLCYNPFFIAMGTTMRDFLNPEFILIGVDDHDAIMPMEEFYSTITNAPLCRMSIESAELTKVAYNTYIGLKIAFANTLMEICHKIPGAHIDDVTRALKGAHKRLISPRYMDGGMGDGGGCHPRDNIAMSWLGRKLSLSHDLFENVMTARERQTEWLADLMCEYDLPKAIIGYSFKAESNLTIGSAAFLLRALLEERGVRPFLYDPHVEGGCRDLSAMEPHVFLIGAKHSEFIDQVFPPGSVIIDPWRYISPQAHNVTLIQVGVGLESSHD